MVVREFHGAMGVDIWDRDVWHRQLRGVDVAVLTPQVSGQHGCQRVHGAMFVTESDVSCCRKMGEIVNQERSGLCIIPGQNPCEVTRLCAYICCIAPMALGEHRHRRFDHLSLCPAHIILNMLTHGYLNIGRCHCLSLTNATMPWAAIRTPRYV